MIPLVLVNAGLHPPQCLPMASSFFVPIDADNFMKTIAPSQNTWNTETAFEFFVRRADIFPSFGNGLRVYDHPRFTIIRKLGVRPHYEYVHISTDLGRGQTRTVGGQ